MKEVSEFVAGWGGNWKDVSLFWVVDELPDPLFELLFEGVVVPVFVLVLMLAFVLELFEPDVAFVSILLYYYC